MGRLKWFDRNGVELDDGDIVCDLCSGKEERVYACHPVDCPGCESLGINASNEEWLARHEDHPREIYPFSNFPYNMVDGKCYLEFFEKVV